MKIELAGWSSEGLRSPDIEIDLRLSGTPASISLVQMPQGTGKTTTLELLRAALSGEATQWTPETVRKYQRPSENVAKGQFVARLRVDGRLLSFELTLGYEDGNVRYRTTISDRQSVVQGWNPPPTFLSSKFIRNFIIDAEHCDVLLDPTHAAADTVIDALWQLEQLHDAKESSAERERIRRVLLAACNDRLNQIEPWRPIELERIDGSIHAREKRGLAAGPSVATGYVFLMSALSLGKIDFPLVVDSPVGMLDLTTRREIGHLIPQLCPQFVALMISTERMGFVDALEKSRKDKTIKYVTVFRKERSTRKLMSGIPRNGVTETKDAILVEGSDYFNKFEPHADNGLD
jgi:hypothetical protein